MRPGPRDELVTQRLAASLEAFEATLIRRESLDPTEAPARLARHLSVVLERALRELEADVEAQAAFINEIVRGFAAPADRQEDLLALPPELLTGVLAPPARLGEKPRVIATPSVPLSNSDLLANAAGQPNIGSELRLELESADSVDLLCAFVIWSGVVRLRDALAGVVQRGGTIRVITTTYMGATQREAVDELVKLGAQVKVAFDARMTKLHAKAWLLEPSPG